MRDAEVESMINAKKCPFCGAQPFTFSTGNAYPEIYYRVICPKNCCIQTPWQKQFQIGTGGRMMKTPDEIKKALRICSGKLLDYCDACNYCNWSSDCACNSRMCADALEYIQQLENYIGELTEKVAQLEEECDLLIADIRKAYEELPEPPKEDA